MNNPIGMCFPDFIGLRPLGLPFLRKAWQEKIPERSEDDFFLSSQALEGSLAAKGRQSKTFAA
mgnify:CR=1 FL=1